MKMSFIYRLTDPETGHLRYIGQTIRTLKDRLHDHCRDKRDCHTTNWIHSLKARGLKPIIEEIIRVPDEQADEMEKLLISYFRSVGCRLTNHDDGGRGHYRTHGRGTKEKMALLKTGRRHSQETKDRMSASHMEHPVSLETREKLSNLKKGTAPSRICLEAATTATRGKPWSRARRDAQDRRQGTPRRPRPQNTHCCQGHEFTPDNTRYVRGGQRVCRTCANARCRKHYDHKKLEVKSE